VSQSTLVLNRRILHSFNSSPNFSPDTPSFSLQTCCCSRNKPFPPTLIDVPAHSAAIDLFFLFRSQPMFDPSCPLNFPFPLFCLMEIVVNAVGDWTRFGRPATQIFLLFGFCTLPSQHRSPGLTLFHRPTFQLVIQLTALPPSPFASFFRLLQYSPALF